MTIISFQQIIIIRLIQKEEEGMRKAHIIDLIICKY